MEITDVAEVSLLESLRHNSGETVAEVVAATGVAHKTLRAYEKGQRRYPTPGVLKALADHYGGVTAADLLADMRRRAAA